MEVKMYKEKIVDLETGIETFRDYTSDEIKEVSEAIEQAKKELAIAETKAAEKAAVLAKLGLTADEVVALLS